MHQAVSTYKGTGTGSWGSAQVEGAQTVLNRLQYRPPRNRPTLRLIRQTIRRTDKQATNPTAINSIGNSIGKPGTFTSSSNLRKNNSSYLCRWQ